MTPKENESLENYDKGQEAGSDLSSYTGTHGGGDDTGNPEPESNEDGDQEDSSEKGGRNEADSESRASGRGKAEGAGGKSGGKDKKSRGEDAKDFAKDGAKAGKAVGEIAAGGVGALNPKNYLDIAKFAKKHAKKILITMAISSPGCLLFFFIIFSGFLLAATLEGADHENLLSEADHNALHPNDNKYDPPNSSTPIGIKDPPPSWACKSLAGNLNPYKEKATNPSFLGGNNTCYTEALKMASEETDVPWEDIAAVDFKLYEQGNKDERKGMTDYPALKQIGDEIQNANYKRNPDTGECLHQPCEKGISIKGSYLDPQDFMHSAEVLRHYKCAYLNKDRPWNYTGYSWPHLKECYECKETDAQSEILKDAWITQNSNIPDMELPCDTVDATDGKPDDNTGAQVFYNFLMQNCEVVGTHIEKDCGVGPGGGGGMPGGGGGVNHPPVGDPHAPLGSVPDFKQYTCPGDPIFFYGTVGPANGGEGGHMSEWACSITAAADVLASMGCDIDQCRANDIANSRVGDVFQTLAESCGFCVRHTNDFSAAIDSLQQTGTAVVINTMGTVDLGNQQYSGGHYVAVTGYNGSGYTVHDPGCGDDPRCGGSNPVSASDFVGLVEANPAQDHIIFSKCQ